MKILQLALYIGRRISMFQQLLNMLFGDSQYSCSNRQTIASVVSKESAKENEMLSQAAEDGPELTLDEEILLLARTYGPIGSGIRIELSLQEALKLFPRKRKRVDAYSKLIKRVHDEYNAELIITSRKTKNNDN